MSQAQGTPEAAVPIKSHTIFNSPAVYDGIAVLFLLIVINAAPPFANDPGVGWHLKTGEWILQHQSIPHFDPFLWSTNGAPWVCNQWLGDIILNVVFKAGGWDAVGIFCFSLPLVCMAVCQSIFLKNSKLPAVLKICLFAVALLTAWMQWIVRPVIFSFCLFSFLFVWLDQCEPKLRRHPVICCIVIAIFFALWANLHPGFPLGFLLIACRTVPFVIHRQYANMRNMFFISSAAFLGTLINPFGINLHRTIFALTRSKYFMGLNHEWQSPSLYDSAFWPFFLLIPVVLATLVYCKSWRTYFAAIITALGLSAVRYTPFLGLIAPSTIAKENQTSWSLETPVTLLVVVVSLLYAAVGELPHAIRYAPQLGVDTHFMDAVESECVKAGGKIINHPDIGGYITLTLWPECKASIDDRNELNGEQKYRDYLNRVTSLDSKLLPEIRNRAELLPESITKRIVATSEKYFLLSAQ